MVTINYHSPSHKSKKEKETKNMKNDTLKFTISGTVTQAFHDNDNHKMTLCVGITPDEAEKITEILQNYGYTWNGENYPVKELEDGSLAFKASTTFTPDLRGIEEEDFPFIGIGSDVCMYVQCKEGKYGRKKYVASYIIGLEVYEFVEYVKNEVFDSDGFVSIGTQKNGVAPSTDEN